MSKGRYSYSKPIGLPSETSKIMKAARGAAGIRANGKAYCPDCKWFLYDYYCDKKKRSIAYKDKRRACKDYIKFGGLDGKKSTKA